VVGPTLGDQPMLDNPVGVVGVDDQQVDATAKPDLVTGGGQQVDAGPRRVGNAHLEVGIHANGGEVVNRRRPGCVGVEQRMTTVQQFLQRRIVGGTFRLAAQRAVHSLVHQRPHDASIPFPHSGEVVHRERVAQCLIQIEGAGMSNRFEVSPVSRAEVPLPTATLEGRPIRHVEAVHHRALDSVPSSTP